jgi:Ca2+-binding EF-hand superfamily protein
MTSSPASAAEEYELRHQHFADYKLFKKLSPFNISWSTVEQLYLVYEKLDLTHRVLKAEDLWSFPDIPLNDFNKRVLNMFDHTQEGSLDFAEFTLFCLLWGTACHHTLCVFMFHLYKTDSNGSIYVHELKVMLASGVGDAHFYDTKTSKKVVSDLAAKLRKKHKDHDSSEDDLEIELDDFIEFVQHHMIVTRPVQQTVDAVKHKVAGKHFWKKLEEEIGILGHGDASYVVAHKKFMHHLKAFRTKHNEKHTAKTTAFATTEAKAEEGAHSASVKPKKHEGAAEHEHHKTGHDHGKKSPKHHNNKKVHADAGK